METMERAVVLTALLVPVIIGLLAKTIEREAARRGLVTWLPIGIFLPHVLSGEHLLLQAAEMFVIGTTAGLTFWSGRCYYRSVQRA